MADLVKQILIWLHYEWDVDVADRPVLIHGDDAAIYSATNVGDATVGDPVGVAEDHRTVDFDLTRGNVVTVSSSSSSNDPVVGGDGTAYHEEPLLSIDLEGVHEDEWGHVANSTELRRLKDEIKHILDNHRSHPLPGEGLRALVIDRDENLSSNFADYYHWTFDLRFVGTR